MAQWGKNDQANNSPIWAAQQLKHTPNTANRDALFGNTTGNGFITNVTTGVFGVDANEIAAGKGTVAHTGWVLRTVGTGGRSGRIQTEVLVAGGIASDNEDTVFPDLAIYISLQPQSLEVEEDDPAVFSVGAYTVPSGGTITYQWEANTGSGFSNLSNGGVYSNVTTQALSISNTNGLDGVEYRVVLRATGAANVTSDTAVLTFSA